MSIRDLVPFRKRESLSRRATPAGGVLSLQEEMNRLFDSFFEDWGALGWPAAGREVAVFAPKVDVKETPKEVRVTAELPGLDEKDLEVTLDEDVLVIRGEKREEHEETQGDVYRSERSYGAFHREVPLPSGVDAAQVKARVKKGVLTVTLPKTGPAADSSKRIPVDVG